MDSIWMQILAFALPGGFLGSVFTWIFSRRKQNNDFLKELQSSINLLSGENKKILEENIQRGGAPPQDHRKTKFV